MGAKKKPKARKPSAIALLIQQEIRRGLDGPIKLRRRNRQLSRELHESQMMVADLQHELHSDDGCGRDAVERLRELRDFGFGTLEKVQELHAHCTELQQRITILEAALERARAAG